MRATILFPGDYFSLNSPNDNFIAELDAVVACDGLDSLLFNYDEYIEGAPLLLSKPAAECAKLLIYRGWMMKPEQYERLYGDLSDLGFDVLTDPLSKAALAAATELLARGLAPRIRVNAVSPGLTLPSLDQTAEEFAEHARQNLLQRPVALADIAAAVEHLLTARSITGQNIFVDCGQRFLQRNGDVMFEGRERPHG